MNAACPPAAAADSVRSMLACRLSGERGTTASLNLHSATPNAFPDAAVEIAVIYSAHAAIAMSQASLVESLQRAVASRQLIGEATGILMERYSVDTGHLPALRPRKRGATG